MLPNQRSEVIYTEAATDFMNELVTILYYKDYFGFMDSALEYVSRIKEFVDTNIHITPHRTAPKYFAKYQPGMSYISYRTNRRTSWYIFFKQSDSRFLVYHITNNHFEGQFIR